MDFERMLSLILRVAFLAAFVLLALVIVKIGADLLLGVTVLKQYSSGRVLELTCVVLVFVMTLLLRQIRDSVSGKRAAR